MAKTAERKQVVASRWRGRVLYQQALNQMPTTIEIRNRDGSRDIRTVDITETVQHLENIKRMVFSRNSNQHYVSISVDDASRISYARRADHRFDTKRRVKTSWQRYITRQLPEEIAEELNHKALDLFVSKWQALSDPADTSDFVQHRGRHLERIYESEIGGHSCMTGEDASPYIQMYVNNPDVFSVLVYTDPDDDDVIQAFKARALITKTDSGTIVMDRIYPNSGSHIELFYNHAKQQGWVYRPHHGYPECDPEEPGEWPRVDVSDSAQYYVTVKTPSYMPYMDTWHFGDTDNDVTAMTNYSSDSTPYSFSSTEGDSDAFPRYQCQYCETIITYHAYNEERACPDCAVEHNTFNCECCGEETASAYESNCSVVLMYPYDFRTWSNSGGIQTRVPVLDRYFARSMDANICLNCTDGDHFTRMCRCCSKNVVVRSVHHRRDRRRVYPTTSVTHCFGNRQYDSLPFRGQPARAYSIFANAADIKEDQVFITWDENSPDKELLKEVFPASFYDSIAGVKNENNKYELGICLSCFCDAANDHNLHLTHDFYLTNPPENFYKTSEDES